MPQCISICHVVLTLNNDFSVRNINGPFCHKLCSLYVISAFHLEVADNCALLGCYYAASSGIAYLYSLRNNVEDRNSVLSVMLELTFSM